MNTKKTSDRDICDETNAAGVRHLTDAELDGIAGGQTYQPEGGFFAEFFKIIGQCSKNTTFTDNPHIIGTCPRD